MDNDRNLEQVPEGARLNGGVHEPRQVVSVCIVEISSLTVAIDSFGLFKSHLGRANTNKISEWIVELTGKALVSTGLPIRVVEYNHSTHLSSKTPLHQT